jgi:hypothetical protein
MRQGSAMSLSFLLPYPRKPALMLSEKDGENTVQIILNRKELVVVKGMPERKP